MEGRRPDRTAAFPVFQATTLITGGWFGFCWGVFMGLFGWSRAPRPACALVTVMAACLAGLLFGLTLASFYARDRRKHQLPAWSTLG